MHHRTVPPLFGPAEDDAARRLLAWGLEEDLGAVRVTDAIRYAGPATAPGGGLSSYGFAFSGDITTDLLVAPEDRGGIAIVARKAGVVAGLPIVPLVFAVVDPDIVWSPSVEDGTRVDPGTVLGRAEGPLAGLLTAERTALNFLTHLSGVASLARKFVDAVAGSRGAIHDTRKTHPGYRILEKYAVRCGGARNHRIGLFDQVLVKDNHVSGWLAARPGRTLRDLVEHVAGQLDMRPSTSSPRPAVQVEVDTFAQFEEILSAPLDMILLDNMSPAEMARAVALRDRLAPRVLLEASGGVSLETVAAIAASGVDRISVGALTHSAPALDIAFDWSVA
jgi:nicotinate-nucleotide pyrophosphorylase (carboxylating)